MSRPKDNLSRLYEILDEADEDILEDIFYYIIGRIGTIRAKKLVDRKEKGMTTLKTFYHKNPFNEMSSVADLRKELEIVRQKERGSREVL